MKRTPLINLITVTGLLAVSSFVYSTSTTDSRDQPYNDPTVYDLTPEGSLSRQEALTAAAIVHKKHIYPDGKEVPYIATTGHIVTKSLASPKRPEMTTFYTAYTRESDNKAQRPITFFFGGAAGSTAASIHLEGWSPMRVYPNTGTADDPIFPLEGNPESLINTTDLVYIDSRPGTGYSQAISPAVNNYINNIDDSSNEPLSELIHDFIIQYLQINERNSSPIYLYTGSQGGVRAAYVINKLYDSGIKTQGAILYSPSLYKNSDSCAPMGTGSCAERIPSVAATSYYYGLVGKGLSLENFMADVYRFVDERYHPEELKALANGTLPPEDVLQELEEKIGFNRTEIGEFPYWSGFTFPKALYISKALLDCPDWTGSPDCPSGSFDLRKEKDAPSTLLPDFFQLNKIAEYYFDQYLRYTNLVQYDCMDGPDKCKKSVMVHVKENPNKAIMKKDESMVPDWGKAMKNNPELRILSMGGYYDFSVPFYQVFSRFADISLDSSRIQTVVLEGGHNISHQSASSRKKMKLLLEQFYENSSAPRITVKNNRAIGAWNHVLPQDLFLGQIQAFSLEGKVIIDIPQEQYEALFTQPGTYNVPLKVGASNAKTQVTLEVLKDSVPSV
ncbi:hypothetical protein OQ483_24510 (plasmid) [Enterobacter bugandensis]|uniref:S10 family serine carboxypeptidase-like protein n=1 Tax=Enterobacter bugandensis TaxID=881260 RepID=UPI00283A8FEF|nr:hypothetical protein [Enterobacter bugandensis]WMU75283.1 hypothetical protein OQ483_24510 [Enterobacter bugandensis]